MKIIPVIDILDGQAVHAIKGKREDYMPVQSILTSSSNPLNVANIFKDTLNLDEIYIADLNSIQGRGNNFEIIQDIKRKVAAKVILDFGIRITDDLHKEIARVIDGLILGTETLSSLSITEKAISLKGRDNILVSIDMRNNQIISSINEFRTPMQAIREFFNMGIRKFILLDLKKVGSMEGISAELKQLVLDIKGLNLYLIIGGGISSVRDIVALQDMGIKGVLLATALHKGKITKKDIDNILRNDKDNFYYPGRI